MMFFHITKLYTPWPQNCILFLTLGCTKHMWVLCLSDNISLIMTILSRVRLMYSLYKYILQICCHDCLAVDRVKAFTTNVNFLIFSWSSDWDQGPIHCSNKIWKITFVVKGPLQPPDISSVDWETDAMEKIQFFNINITHNASKMK